jgi:uncharacterized membrane protein AbrB (regulator of aidB expression)
MLFYGSLLALILCAAAGSGSVQSWVGVALAIALGPAWVLALKSPASWLPFFCLLASVGLAAVERLWGAPAGLVLAGGGLALVVWDLVFLNSALDGGFSGEQTRRYEKKHLQSLGLAVGSGLAVASLGRWLNLQLPFFLLIIFILLVFFGLERIWGHFAKMNRHN